MERELFNGKMTRGTKGILWEIFGMAVDYMSIHENRDHTTEVGIMVLNMMKASFIMTERLKIVMKENGLM